MSEDNTGGGNQTDSKFTALIEDADNWMKKTHKHLAVLASVAASIFLGVLAVPRLIEYTEHRADTWLDHARHLAEPAASPALVPHPPGVSESLAKRLEAQLTDVRNSAHYHIRVARDFSRYQFILLTLATTCGVIAGVLLVPISWKGWRAAEGYFTVLFLLTAGFGILVTSFNQVYRQKENLEDNARLYFAYLTLEDRILSYYPIYEGVTSGKEKPGEGYLAPAEFVAHVDQQVGALRSLAVSFDAAKAAQFSQVYNELNAPLTQKAAAESTSAK